jgi:hypothetical protein
MQSLDMKEIENIDFKSNNMALQAIPWEDNCDFHQGKG